MSKAHSSTYIFREQRRNTQMGGHVYEEKWECPVFSGGDPPEFLDFWVEFTQIYQRAEWTEDMVFEKLSYVLHGSPLRMIYGLQELHPNDIAGVLFAAYAPQGYEWEFRRQIEEASIFSGENLQKYRERVAQHTTYFNLMVNFYGGHQMTMRDVFHYFIKGLPLYYQQKVREHPTLFSSIHEAWPYLTRLEMSYKMGQRNYQPKGMNSHHYQHGTSKPYSPFKTQGQPYKGRSEPKNVFQGTSASHEHRQSYNSKRSSKFCKFCRKKGHNLDECYKRKDKERDAEVHYINQQEEVTNQVDETEFYIEDPYLLMVKNSVTENPSAITTFEISQDVLRKLRYVLFDTGSRGNLIKFSCLPKNLQHKMKPSKGLFTTANSAKVKSKGKITLLIRFTGLAPTREVEIVFEVLDELAIPCIVGTQTFRRLGIDLLFSRNVICWGELECPFLSNPGNTNEIEDRITALVNANYSPTAVETLIPDTLAMSEKDQLMKILEKYQTKLFSGKLGEAKVPPHKPLLRKDATPYYSRPYSIPFSLLEITKIELRRLQDLGIIRPAPLTPWGAPCFVIPKKNNTPRLVVDYRRLNKEKIRRPFPLPRIQDILFRLGNKPYLSQLDLNMGYYSIPIAKEFQDLYAFTTPWGKFTYQRLPFGDSEAPDIFQRVMNTILGDMPAVFVYLDDILVASKDFPTHLKDLNEVLRRLETANMSINGTKSSLLKKEVEYLGFIINAKGCVPDPRKVQAIQALDHPTNKKSLRRFVGMVNHIRRHLPGLSATIAPLTSMTGADHKFEWNAQLEQSFVRTKELVSKAALLQHPDFKNPFLVYTDASDFAYGGVIIQSQGPITYFSKKYQGAEKNYSVIEKELLAIVRILDEHRTLLWGQKIIVYTDHKNLEAERFTSLRVTRWRLTIEEFGPQIEYLPGKHNIIADGLSRLPFSTETPIPEDILICTIIPEDCPVDLMRIFEHQKNDTSMNKAELEQQKFGNRVLFTRNKAIVIPKSLQPDMLDFYHGVLLHPGSTRMYHSMSAVTWKGMQSDVENYVKSCHICKSSKNEKPKFGKLPLSFPTVVPWESVAIDLIGPFGTNGEIQKYGYAVTIMDLATRWLEIAPIKDKSSVTVALTFDRWWLCRYPRPTFCVHDQGKEFVGSEFQELLKSYGIESVRTTVKNPQANGTLERVHQVINNALRTSGAGEQDWHEHLQNIAFAIRSSFNRVLKTSPAQLIYGRHMLFPIQTNIDMQSQLIRKFRQMIKDNNVENQKRKTHTFRVGDPVLIYDSVGFRKKLDTAYKGPYVIRKVHANGTVSVDFGTYLERLNIRRVKPFEEEGARCRT